MTESRSPQSEFSKRTNAAMQEAAEDVLERARRHNTPIVVWRDGKVVELDPFSPEFGQSNTDGDAQQYGVLDSDRLGQPTIDEPFSIPLSPQKDTTANSVDTSDIVSKADAAMREAAKDVVERARRYNSPIVLWRDGKVVELDPFSPEFDEPHLDDAPTENAQ